MLPALDDTQDARTNHDHKKHDDHVPADDDDDDDADDDGDDDDDDDDDELYVNLDLWAFHRGWRWIARLFRICTAGANTHRTNQSQDQDQDQDDDDVNPLASSEEGEMVN